jgi:hypothetical protein
MCREGALKRVGEMGNYARYKSEKPKKLGQFGVDWRMILKWIFEN